MGLEDIPSEFVNDDGRVHLEVIISKFGKRMSSDISKTVSVLRSARDSSVMWVDAASALGQGDVPMATRLAKAVSSKVSPARITVAAPRWAEEATTPVVRSQAADCPQYKLEATSRRKAKIAHTFVPTGTRSIGWAYHSSVRSHTMGRAAFVGGGAWAKSSSSKTIMADNGFEWEKNRAVARAYKAEVRYGRYRYQSEDPDGGCTQYDHWVWSPIEWTGGFANRSWTVQPTWGRSNCVTVNPGTWKRHRSDGTNFSSSGGVEMKEVVGFDLSSERSYATNAYIAYKIVGVKKLCGSDRTAGLARDVRMAKTW